MISSLRTMLIDGKVGRYPLLDLLVVGAAITSLILSCVLLSPKKYFWNDELFSWYFLADPSFGHMWEAFHDRINNTPPLYFLLGWGWAWLFGASELSLRLFSSLGFGVALGFVWATLRRVYGFWPTCMGVLIVFMTSDIVLSQNVEARMYGLFLALGAGAVYQYATLVARSTLTWIQLAGLALVHAGIVHTHLFGPFYSAAILGAFLLSDLRAGKPRKGLYLAIVAGWLSFLFYLPSFLIQSDAGYPRAWVPEPWVSDLTGLVGLATPSFLHVAFLIGLLLLLVLVYTLSLRHKTEEKQEVPMTQEWYLLVVAGALISVPVVMWLISRLAKPVFWDRYLVPSIIGYSVLIAHLTARYVVAWRKPGVRLVGNLLLGGLTLILLVHPLLYGKRYTGRSLPGYFDSTFGHDGLPMVVSVSAAFLERWHYSPEKTRYYFVLDREASLSPESGQFGVQEYKHMEAFKRNYPERVGRHILESEVFLERFDRFLVLDSGDYDAVCPERVFGLEYAREWKQIHCPRWLETRILGNPAYRVTELGRFDWNEAILLVERVRDLGEEGLEPTL